MIVMSIAGVDPSAGAGVFADIKTFQAIGVYGYGVITALTSQNPNKVYSIKAIESEYVEEQIDAVLDFHDVEFIKTGMLYSTDTIKTIAKKIKEYDLKAIVDPVMIATAGGNLAKDDLSHDLNKYLLPKACLTTPNISEAEKLTNMEIKNVDDAVISSKILAKKCNTFITGGHLDGLNTLNIDNNVSIYKQKLLKTDNLHGTGCNLSSAITAYLAKGNDLEKACRNSFDYVYKSIKNGKYGTLIADL